MTHTILIASTVPSSCNAILSITSNHEFPYIVSGIATSTEALLRLVDENRPSIVIVDCTSPENTCYEQIRCLRSSFGYELQILAMGMRSFSSVYGAIQSGANHYILVPIHSEEFLAALSTLTAAYEKIINKNTAARSFFLSDSSIDTLRDRPITMQQLNDTYDTHFKEGLFQLIFIKFDFPNSFERLSPENTPVFVRLSDFITEYFKEDYTDIIYEIKKDGIMFLINYEEYSKNSVNAKILELYDHISTLVHTFRDMDTTVCISSAVDSPSKVWEIKKQVRDAEWSRMHYGLNKIIFWTQSIEDAQGIAEKKLESIIKNTSLAISSLNSNKFSTCLNEFYSLSPNILISRAARTFIRQTISQIFQAYWDMIASFTDPTECYDTLSYCLHLCTSFSQHRRTLLRQCTELMERITEQSQKEYSPAVMQIMAYVKNNIDRPILLEDAAAEVQLSKGYFSFLFKKETGINFTKYVNTHKNTVACDLLKNSNLNISEIAVRIGMTDVRAFSKKFHTINGITPSNYRKLHISKKAQVL